MARMKTTAAFPKSVQEARERLEMDMDAPGTRESMEGVANGLIVGPADPAELLGCQDEGSLQEGELTEFAVTAEHGLRLRERPSLDAPVLAVLPWGAGVFADERPVGEWVRVTTGLLSGYMLAERLVLLDSSLKAVIVYA